jgi:hypothetical protein
MFPPKVLRDDGSLGHIPDEGQGRKCFPVLLPSIAPREIPAIYQISDGRRAPSGASRSDDFSISTIANLPKSAADHRLIARCARSPSRRIKD